MNETRNQRLRDASGNPSELADAIPPRDQLNVIASLDLAAAFGLGGAHLVTHGDPLPPTPTGVAVVRHASAVTPCYAELIIKRLVFTRNALAGGALQGFFIFRKFTGGDTPVRSFTSMTDSPLTIFPWKRPQDEMSGRAELREALSTDLLAFAHYASQPPVRRH